MSWMVKMARVSRCGKIAAETNMSSVHDDYEHTISRRAYLNRIDVTLAERKTCKLFLLVSISIFWLAKYALISSIRHFAIYSANVLVSRKTYAEFTGRSHTVARAYREDFHCSQSYWR
jgi:hypothetical protein